MNFRDIDLCCPHCHGAFAEKGETLRCLACQSVFPVLAGIPDLRIFPDPYIGFEADRKKGLQLAARLPDLSFSELIDYYYSITGVVPPQHARQYKRGLLAGAARAEAMLTQWEQAAPGSGTDLLEVGCGTGPFLLAASKRFPRLVGVDIAFRWLVVARKRLEEAGLDIPLICACAEALPFRSESFDYTVLDSAIEVIGDQRKALDECHRAMRSKGHLFVSTPNRYSLGPDPHLGVWAGGWWPQRLLNRYARWRGAVPPKRRLLCSGTLKRLLRQTGFTETSILLPRISAGHRSQFGKGMQWLISLYQMAQQLPVSRQLLFWIGPLLQAVARKPGLANR